jgi:hypothetical protein
MKRIAWLAAAFSVLAITGPARAELWCLSDFGAGRGTCVFPSAQDCVRAAVVAGGRCERDTALQGKREPKRSPDAAVRRNRSADGWFD